MRTFVIDTHAIETTEYILFRQAQTIVANSIILIFGFVRICGFHVMHKYAYIRFHRVFFGKTASYFPEFIEIEIRFVLPNI